MKLWSALRNLLPVLAILGLVLGPLTLPAAAMTSAGAPAAAVDTAGMDMGEDMPCCPTKQAPPCDKSCPLMTLCVAKCFPAVPSLSMMTTLESLPSTEPGVYRFTTNLTMQGGWQLSHGAKVQGETGSVESKLVLKAIP